MYIIFNNNNNAKDEQQNTFCIVGTIPVSIDDPTPSSVPTNQLLSNVEKIAASLCGGIQVVGIYVFVRATGRDSSLLSNLESSLNSFPSNNNNNKIANNKIALQLTSNHASARILNNTGGAGRQADIKFTSLQEQYVFLQSSLSLNIQLYGNSNDSLANLYDENTLFHKFKNNMIIQVDNKYMPSDIATNIPIGHLPYRDIHNVKFYPESDVIVGSNKNNNKQKNNTLVHFKGTFHFKAYVHEKNSTKTGLELLLNDLKFSIKKRFEMCSVPEKDSNNGIIEYVPIRYEVTSSSTVLSKCFLNYFILSKDNDVMDAVDDVKTELAQIGILAKEVITNESVSIRNILGINILRKCKDGKLVNYASEMEPVSVMKQLPKSISIASLQPFLEKVIQHVTHRKRQDIILCNVAKVENLQARSELAKLESRGVVVDTRTLCDICKKPIDTKTVFVVYPNNVVAHYSCLRGEERLKFDPISGKRFVESNKKNFYVFEYQGKYIGVTGLDNFLS